MVRMAICAWKNHIGVKVREKMKIQKLKRNKACNGFTCYSCLACCVFFPKILFLAWTLSPCFSFYQKILFLAWTLSPCFSFFQNCLAFVFFSRVGLSCVLTSLCSSPFRSFSMGSYYYTGSFKKPSRSQLPGNKKALYFICICFLARRHEHIQDLKYSTWFVCTQDLNEIERDDF